MMQMIVHNDAAAQLSRLIEAELPPDYSGLSVARCIELARTLRINFNQDETVDEHGQRFIVLGFADGSSVSLSPDEES